MIAIHRITGLKARSTSDTHVELIFTSFGEDAPYRVDLFFWDEDETDRARFAQAINMVMEVAKATRSEKGEIA